MGWGNLHPFGGANPSPFPSLTAQVVAEANPNPQRKKEAGQGRRRYFQVPPPQANPNPPRKRVDLSTPSVAARASGGTANGSKPPSVGSERQAASEPAAQASNPNQPRTQRTKARPPTPYRVGDSPRVQGAAVWVGGTGGGGAVWRQAQARNPLNIDN